MQPSFLTFNPFAFQVLSESEIDKSASVESNRSSIGTSSDRPKSGTFTILKRPTQATRVESATDDNQESLTDNQKARKQILAELGISSPERSERLPETARRRSSTPPDTERSGRAGASQVADRREVSLNKKSSEDVDSPRVSISQQCQDDVMTGDLLGLGLNENVPDDEKRSMSKEQDVSLFKLLLFLDCIGFKSWKTIARLVDATFILFNLEGNFAVNVCWQSIGLKSAKSLKRWM